MRNLVARGLRKIANKIDTQHQPVFDEYIEWLIFVNAGMLTRGNLYSIEYAVQNLPGNASVIEIGSFCGLSTNIISHYLKKYQRSNPLITCDRWIFEGQEEDAGSFPDPSITWQEYRDFVKESYIRNIGIFSKNRLLHTIEMFSDELFEEWGKNSEVTDILGSPVQLGGNVSFCYIDGNHSYEYAKRDFENCDRYLVKGGFILFDDSADFSGWEVTKVISQVKASGNYKVIVNNPNYLFQKIGA